MKYRLLLLGLLLSTSSIGQINTEILKGEWVLVDYMGDKGLGDKNILGFYLNFNDYGVESLDFQDTIFIDYKEFEIRLKQSNQEIILISKDSIVFTDHKYFPLKKPKMDLRESDLEELLFEFSWRIGENISNRLKFLKYIKLNFENLVGRQYFIENADGFFVENNYWIIYSCKNYIFLIMGNHLYLISELNDNKISTICYSENKIMPVDFYSIPGISSRENVRISEMLSSKVWKTRNKIINNDAIENGLGMQISEDSTNMRMTILPNILNHSLNYPSFVKFYSFSYKYEFKENGEYIISSSKKRIIKRGKWCLSNDGNYIVLEIGNENEYYIRILEISNKTLKLAQLLSLKLNRKEEEFYICNLEIELK